MWSHHNVTPTNYSISVKGGELNKKVDAEVNKEEEDKREEEDDDLVVSQAHPHYSDSDLKMAELNLRDIFNKFA